MGKILLHYVCSFIFFPFHHHQQTKIELNMSTFQVVFAYLLLGFCIATAYNHSIKYKKIEREREIKGEKKKNLCSNKFMIELGRKWLTAECNGVGGLYLGYCFGNKLMCKLIHNHALHAFMH